METVSTKTKNSSYDIYIGSKIYRDIPEIISQKRRPSKAVVITNRVIAPKYGNEIEYILRDADIETESIIIRAGESNKSLSTILRIYENLAEMNLDRHAAIVAVGGGVVCDIGGFIAATYLRGLDLYQVPTTLLAQVDASVGGKNGVDLPQGKNLVGTFYQPTAVIADVSTLRTLPVREMRSGMAEIVKHGVVYDEDYFKYIRSRASYMTARNEEEMIKIIRRSVEIKADVVASDEFDEGIRGILNFGHTVGHALEVVTDYRSIKHGEAVAIGMITESIIAEMLGICQNGTTGEIANTVVGLRLPVQIPDDVSTSELIEAMNYDKKTVAGNLRMALPTALGHAQMVESIPRDIVAEAIDNHRKMDILSSWMV